MGWGSEARNTQKLLNRSKLVLRDVEFGECRTIGAVRL